MDDAFECVGMLWKTKEQVLFHRHAKQLRNLSRICALRRYKESCGIGD